MRSSRRAAARVARWTVWVVAGLWVGHLMGDQDLGAAIVAVAYPLSWQRWPDSARARDRS